MKTKYTSVLMAMLIFILASCGGGANKVYDVVIFGGTVIDPETKLEAVRNVGIDGNKIIAVTDKQIQGRETIDATGQVVCAGFIDLHAHGQNITADRMQVFDGVTTTLELESGILPISEWYDNQAKEKRLLNYGASAGWTFARISEMEGIEMKADLEWFQKAFSLNKWVNNPAKAEQVQGILARIEQGLKEGGLGVGINGGYAPGGGYKELLAVHDLAARYGVGSFTHISSDFPDDPNSAAECVGDIISWTAVTGGHSHVCHLNSSSLKDISTTRDMIIKAQKRGLPITVEAYTYGASSTTIGSALFNEEGIERKHICFGSIALNGVPLNEKTFAETRKKEPGAVIVFNFLNMPEDEHILDQSVLFPGGAIASDAMPWADKNTGKIIMSEQWPVSPDAFAHPRSAGTFTRLFAHWVRERKALTMMEAVEKTSLIPAQILEAFVPQMKKKGRLQEGMDADIIVFNPETVQDNATFTQPTLLSSGMKYVFVNGAAVIKNGELDINARPGQPIRRDITK